MVKFLLILVILNNFLFGSYLGKGGLYNYKHLSTSQKDGGSFYRIYCVEKNSIFSISNHRVFKNLNGKWFDTLMNTNNPKYMGMTFDGLDVNMFGEKVCN